MLIFIIIQMLLLLSQVQPLFQCKCGSIKVEKDCEAAKCFWDNEKDTKCLSLSCSDRGELQCYSLNSHPFINTIVNEQCQLDLSNNCVSVDDEGTCPSILLNSEDSWGTKLYKCALFRCGLYTDEPKKCVDTIQCKSRKDQNGCQGFHFTQDENYVCYWENDNCSEMSMTLECSNRKNQFLCEVIGNCRWENDKCRNLQCSDLDSYDCKIIGIDSKPIFCTLVEEKCSQVELIKLNEQTCQAQTLNNYQWVDNECSACPKDVFSQIQIGSLMIWLFLLF